ncbi:MAG TPA: type 1 pili tip component [Candidatus Competibacteraceae bacterium]|nr:type 1 pili tip component [Candidatus Competibacteraceae bacterium]
MDIKSLLEQWEKSGQARITAHEYRIRLPIHDAARIAALAEMYPLKSEQDIIMELLSAALDAVEEAFPYKRGTRVIAEDELGDPIYEDVGPTPRFLALTKRHTARLEAELKECGSRQE